MTSALYIVAHYDNTPSPVQFLPRDASAERGYEIACRLSVCLSVTFTLGTVFK